MFIFRQKFYPQTSWLDAEKEPIIRHIILL